MNKDYYFKLNQAYPQFTLDVEFDLAEGEFFSLLGSSGCGKTTLLRLLAGLESGIDSSIIIKGRSVGDLPPFKRNVGMVFQEYALFPHLNVFENVAYGLRAHHHTSQSVKKRVGELIDLFELNGLEKRNVNFLSGGEKQRVALARSIAVNPQILLLDEPFSALDHSLRLRLRKQLRDYQRQLGITTIFVTHQQEEALQLSDRLAVMSNGRFLQVGTPQEIYETPCNAQVAEFMGEGNWIDDCFVRPENLCVLPQNADSAVGFEATVKTIEYFGYLKRVELTSVYGDLISFVPTNRVLSSGERIFVKINQENLIKKNEIKKEK